MLVNKCIKSKTKDILYTSKEIMYTFLNGNMLDNVVVASSSIILSPVGTPIGNLINTARKNFPDITNQLFINKFYYVLSNMQDIDLDIKINFYNNYVSNNEDKFYTNFLLILNAIEHQDKCMLVAKFFKAFIYERIDENEWAQINHIILNLSYDDLENISKLQFYETTKNGKKVDFIDCNLKGNIKKYFTLKKADNVALIYLSNSQTIDYVANGNLKYRKTSLGIKFFELYNFGELN